jgi:peptide-methionine (R)-S-oxide reductase
MRIHTPIFCLAMIVGLVTLIGCESGPADDAHKDHAAAPSTAPASTTQPVEKITKSDEEWKKLLTPEQYIVLRQKGTEPAFHNAYWDNHDKGIYRCAACGLELFNSDDKFDSGTGWPSYTRPIQPNHVEFAPDADGSRTEIECARCGGHLGHVFDDGPAPTGKRFCMDSAALKFEKK